MSTTRITLYETPLHDGSKALPRGLHPGHDYDLMIAAKKASPVFDKAKQAGLEAWLDTFKGVKIVSEDPLVIETYSDMWYMDAELNASDPTDTWYPQYGTYAWSGYWHMIALGWMAEAEKSLAFSQDKSDDLGVEQMDYTRGRACPFLKSAWRRPLRTTSFPTSRCLENTSAPKRRRALEQPEGLLRRVGPLLGRQLDRTSSSRPSVEKQVVLTRFADYPDPADRFFFFLEDLANSGVVFASK